MKKNDNFNSLFWHIIGVNNKVYQFTDIFPSIPKNPSQIRYKNMRAKEADEKSYERFLDSTLQDEAKIIDFKTNEILIFTKLLKSFVSSSKDYDFYFKQFFNLIINYHSFSKPSFSSHKMMNLFVFQLAYILEYMRHHKLNIELFELSIKDNSIKPFLKECQKTTKRKALSDLAIEMSHNHEEVKNIMLKDFIYLKSITETTFKKYLSSWMSTKSLPNLIHMFTIATTLHKGVSRQTEANLLQLILARALLYIQYEYDISVQTKEGFLEKLRVFQTKIEVLYKNDASEIVNLQNEHLRNFSLIFEFDNNSLLSIVGDTVTN